MTSEQLNFLQEIADNEIDPYSTMAQNAILWNDLDLLHVLENRQKKCEKIILDALLNASEKM